MSPWSEWDDKAMRQAELNEPGWYAPHAFRAGAEWQRAQLRTNEAVECVAEYLHQDDCGETIAQHETNCERCGDECDARGNYMRHARRAIDALLAEPPPEPVKFSAEHLTAISAVLRADSITLSGQTKEDNPMNPECKQGKHRNCDGTAWDDETDALAPCGCTCHIEPTH